MKRSLFAACLFVAVAVWLSSGTMAPYASTLQLPRIDKPCNYLLNTDHVHFEACFLMLDGAPREQWDYSIYLRRILYPLLAFPLMKVMGFLAGGVVASILIQLAAFTAFVVYVRRRVGEAGAYTAMALVASYPGLYYWAGLPYCHAMIVPACLLGMMILCELERDGLTLAWAALLALGMGVLFLAYDLLPILGPAVLIVLVFRRRFAAAAVALPMLLLPTIGVNAVLDWLYDLPFRNKNTQAYFDIAQAYLREPNWGHWGDLLSRVPGDTFRNYFFSNFYFLPGLFLALLIANRFTMRLRLTLAEKSLLGMTLLLFAFINLAPPTRGWVFRGSGIARIYQPMFAAMILFAARVVQAGVVQAGVVQGGVVQAGLTGAAASPIRAGSAVGLIGAAVLLNTAIVLGPVLRITLADRVYYDFYRHADGPKLSLHLDTFGRRPLGFCDESITIENKLSKRELKLRKEKKARDKAKKLKAETERKARLEAKPPSQSPSTATPAAPASAPAAP